MPLKPNEVKTEHIANGAVTTPKISDAQVSSSKLQDKSVIMEKIATGAVTRDKIGEKQVSSSRLKDACVTTEKIATGAVVASKIGDGQVTTVKIGTKAVDSSKLALDSVTTKKIQDGAVTTEKIAGLAVTAGKIAGGAVIAEKLGTNAVTTAKIADGAVTPPKLSFTPATRPLDPPVTRAELADGSVDSSKLAVDSVTTDKITPQSVNREKLNDDVIAAFGHKFNFVSPWHILGPATYENAVPWTELPLATHLPEGTLCVILQAEMRNPEMVGATDISMNIRKDSSQEAALSVGHQGGTIGTKNFSQGIVPVTEARTIEWDLEGSFGPPPKRIEVSIKLIGYIA